MGTESFIGFLLYLLTAFNSKTNPHITLSIVVLGCTLNTCEHFLLLLFLILLLSFNYIDFIGMIMLPLICRVNNDSHLYLYLTDLNKFICAIGYVCK